MALDREGQPIGEAIRISEEHWSFVDRIGFWDDKHGLEGGLQPTKTMYGEIDVPPDAHAIEFRRLEPGASTGSGEPIKVLVASLPPAPTSAWPMSTQLHGTRPPGCGFDIVILAEGFQKSELNMFMDRAKVLTKGLLATPPWDKVSDKVNVFAIPVESVDSGVDDCPYIGVKKNTAFDVRGDFNGLGSPGFFGTDRPDLVQAAAASIGTTWPYVDLVIVLVNTNFYGGHGVHEERTAFIGNMDDDKELVHLTAHESMHAICGLTDEYFGYIGPPSGFTAPNFATEEQRLAHSVGWWNLTAVAERNGTEFTIVHQVGDPLDSGGTPIVAAGFQNALGLFWGCSFIEQPLMPDPGPASIPDLRGGRYYRPMARCKMRRLREPFCRVCGQTLADAVELAAALPCPQPPIGPPPSPVRKDGPAKAAGPKAGPRARGARR